MSVIISARSGTVTEAQKNYAKEKAETLLENPHKVSSVRVTLGAEKNRFKAEVVVHGKGMDIEADFESFDMREAIDKAIDKADKQLYKHVEKTQSHHKATPKKPEEATEGELEEV